MGNTFGTINDTEHIRYYLFFARLACIPFVLLGGYFGYYLASELYGKLSGFVFLLLWTFSPSTLGWGSTICPDAAAASIGIVGLYAFRCWLKNPDWQKAIVAGICLGLMPLIKITWIIAPPIFCILWLAWQLFHREVKKPPFYQLFIIICIGLYILNMGYFLTEHFVCYRIILKVIVLFRCF